MSRLNIPITEVKASSSFFTESFIDIFVIQQIDCKFQTTSDKRGKEKETERNNFKNKSFFATSISTSPSLKIKINVQGLQLFFVILWGNSMQPLIKMNGTFLKGTSTIESGGWRGAYEIDEIGIQVMIDALIIDVFSSILQFRFFKNLGIQVMKKKKKKKKQKRKTQLFGFHDIFFLF